MIPAALASLRAAAVMLLASVVGCSAQTTTSPNADTLATLERQILATINTHRASMGLASLPWSDVIADQARQHSASMAAGTTPVGHAGFDERVAIIGQAIPWTDAAEVVAVTANDSTASAVVNAWLVSPEHKVYIEGDFDVAGIGVAVEAHGSRYSTGILIKSR